MKKYWPILYAAIAVLAIALCFLADRGVHKFYHRSTEIGPGIPRQTPTTPQVSSQPGTPAQFMSCLELQRYLNSLDPDLNLKEDGICGPATMRAWNSEINNQYALELWPKEK